VLSTDFAQTVDCGGYFTMQGSDELLLM